MTSLLRKIKQTFSPHRSPTKGLEDRAHEPSELVAYAIRYLNRPRNTWTATEKRSFRLRNDWREREFFTFSQGTEPSHLQMVYLITCFDDIFFGGVLRGKVEFEYSRFLSAADGTTLRGYTEKLSRDEPATRYINPGWRPVLLSGHEYHLGVIRTLLHESCHAYLQLYACHSRTCSKNGGCRVKIGEDGHGEAWIKLAYALEDTAMKVLNLTPLNLVKPSAAN